ncbi:RUN and FYVE domain-containing protein 4-like [Rhinatrema bivittatum]|uniref:RUN and FYVE domain-containing protein 4-like n=1 Tax=Rhinatrema bivittatum TaxID=194408 RepID=UPI00112755CA|nr:RUN and FYVE domain-containing protein 4-like [Rhinatrema bivittatum]
MMELADLVQKQKEEAGKLKESLNDQLDKVKTESQLKNQILRAKETELKGLAEQLRRASLDCERCGNGPEKGEQDGKEDEHKYLETIAEQKDMIQSLKARVLELVREKDALWEEDGGH